MIVIDSSAIIAIFRQEDDAAQYAHSIATDDDPIMSAANVVETSIVLRGLKKVAPDKAERRLDDFLEAAGIQNRAGNAGAGPCGPLSPYAVRKRHRPCGVTELWRLLLIRLAKEMNVPLLCKGNDFRLTDIRIV